MFVDPIYLHNKIADLERKIIFLYKSLVFFSVVFLCVFLISSGARAADVFYDVSGASPSYEAVLVGSYPYNSSGVGQCILTGYDLSAVSGQVVDSVSFIGGSDANGSDVVGLGMIVSEFADDSGCLSGTGASWSDISATTDYLFTDNSIHVIDFSFIGGHVLSDSKAYLIRTVATSSTGTVYQQKVASALSDTRSVNDANMDVTGSYSASVATVCGNYVCETGETPQTCPADCGSRLNPTATVIHPEPSGYVEQQVINAVGSNAYYVTVASSVLSTEFPNESDATVEIKIFQDDGVTLQCQISDTANDGNSDGYYHYGTNTAWLVNGTKSDGITPCSYFALSADGENYKIAARWKFQGFNFGSWSDQATFRVVPYGYVPAITCPEDSAIFSICWFQSILQFLLSPSSSVVNGFYGTIGTLADRWPISWFQDTFDAVSGSVNQSVADVGEPHGGSFLGGDIPDWSWFAHQVRMFYGDWASPASCAGVWICALIAIGRSGKRLLNIDDDDEYELG